jgi:uncharacterized membrane protein
MQTQPPPGYQPGGWQQPNTYQPPVMQPSDRARTQTFNMEPNVAGGLCYLPFFFIHFILPVIFIASEPRSNRFVRFHAFQALFMAITGIVGGVGGYLAFVLGMVFSALLAGATQSPAAAIIMLVVVVIAVVLLGSFAIFMLVCTIVACVKAFSGEIWRVPVIGKLADRFA